MKKLKIRLFKYIVKKLMYEDPTFLYHCDNEYWNSRKAVSKKSFKRFNDLRRNPNIRIVE